MVAKTDPNALGRVRLETRRLADLVPAPFNPRTISDGALAGLGESIGRFGLVQPIIVNSRTGHVVGGHQRLKVLEARGVEATDVIVIDVEEAEEKALNLALNSPQISGEWTADALGLLDEVVGALPELGEALLLGGLRGDPRRGPRAIRRARRPGTWGSGGSRTACTRSARTRTRRCIRNGAHRVPPFDRRPGRAALSSWRTTRPRRETRRSPRQGHG